MNDQIGALSNIVSFQDIEISELSNLVVDNISEIASLSNEYYPFKTSTNAKITSLQEFDLVFYNDLRNIDNKVDDAASNISQNASNIISLSNNLSLYIPQSDKPDLINPTWVAPLQSDVKISGFDIDVSIQGPPGVSPEDPMYLPPTPLTTSLDRGYEYVSNNTPDVGYDVFRLSGDGGVLFTNANLPVTISLKVPKSVVTKSRSEPGSLVKLL